VTDKRKIEIIDMVLDWFEKNPHKFHIYGGICYITYKCVKKYEAIMFNEYLMSTTKRRWYSQYSPFINGYIFKPGNIKPRVNYLNELKKKLLSEE